MFGGDTTMQVTAHIFPLELPEPGASVTFTATYDMPYRRILRAPVIQRLGESNALFALLQALGDSIRTRSVRVP